MPTVDQIQDKNGNNFDIEDSDAQAKIGDLTELETDDKSDLVSAINETKGQLKSFRFVDLARGNLTSIPARTATYVESTSTTLAADEIPVGVIKYDAGWGQSPGQTMITAWELIFNNSTKIAYFRGEVYNNTDSTMTVGCSGRFIAAKVGA